jgi:hypothetical protein
MFTGYSIRNNTNKCATLFAVEVFLHFFVFADCNTVFLSLGSLRSKALAAIIVSVPDELSA